MNNKLPIYITINEPKKAFYSPSVSVLPTLLKYYIDPNLICINKLPKSVFSITISNNLFRSKLNLHSFPAFGNT